MSATLKYMFSITSELPTRQLGRTPAGHRFDVEYRSTSAANTSSVTTDPLLLLGHWGVELTEWARRDDAAHLKTLKKAAEEDKDKDIEAALKVIEDYAPARQRSLKDHPTVLDLLVGDVSSLALSAEAERTLASKEREARKALREQCAKFLKLVSDVCEKNRIQGRPWLGLNGHILSGVDWALLRSDGVIEFDGQLTLTDGPLDDKKRLGVLVNARTSGAVDLVRPGDPRPHSIDHAFELWRTPRDSATVPLALAFKFEAAREPEPWASKKYTRSGGHQRYAALSRGQFVGCGRIKLEQSQALKITLDVLQVVPPGELSEAAPPRAAAAGPARGAEAMVARLTQGEPPIDDDQRSREEP